MSSEVSATWAACRHSTVAMVVSEVAIVGVVVDWLESLGTLGIVIDKRSAVYDAVVVGSRSGEVKIDFRMVDLSAQDGAEPRSDTFLRRSLPSHLNSDFTIRWISVPSCCESFGLQRHEASPAGNANTLQKRSDALGEISVPASNHDGQLPCVRRLPYTPYLVSHSSRHCPDALTSRLQVTNLSSGAKQKRDAFNRPASAYAIDGSTSLQLWSSQLRESDRLL